jgi:hypothetical protein
MILDYTKRPRSPHRNLRVAIVVMSAVLASQVVMRFAPPWVERTRYLIRQTRCMWHTLPGEFVLYEDCTADSPLLAGGDANFVRLERHADCMDPGWVGTGPPPRRPPGPAGYRSVLLDSLVPGFGGLLFLHGRQMPDGQESLVVVRATPGVASYYGRLARLHVEGFRPAGWSGAATLQPHAAGADDYFYFEMNLQDQLRIFAGQPDPHDSSRFTIPYELNGRRGAVEGSFTLTGKLTFKHVFGPLGSYDREALYSRTRVAAPAGR